MMKEKKIVTAIAIASISALLAITPAVPVVAAAGVANTAATDAGIVDWSAPIDHAMDIFGQHAGKPGTYGGSGPLSGFSDVKYHEFSVEADGSPRLSNSKTVFVGSSTLVNDSDTEQTLSTDSFTQQFTNSVTSSTTVGFKFGEKISSKFEIPLVAEVGAEVSTEFDFSDTSSNTKTETHTYTAQPQNIKVPPHSSVEVIVKLDTVKASGNVKLLSKMSGQKTGSIIYNNPNAQYLYNLSFHDIVDEASKYEKLSNVYANPDGETITLVGAGNYEAEYGTQFMVHVMEPKPLNENGRVKRDLHEEDYAYEVTPVVNKAE